MSQREVAFMGRMTARMTHEVLNMLAVLKESSGLMVDILAVNRDVDFSNRDRMEQSLSRIHKKIAQGVDLLKQFSWLAHSMDEPEAEVEINDLLDHTSALMNCFARLKKVELQTIPSEAPVFLKTDPFRLHWVLSSCIDYALKEIPEGGTIILRAGIGQKKLQLQVLYGPDIIGKFTLLPLKEILPTELAFLDTALEALGMRLSRCDATGTEGLILEADVQ